jgi:AhpD family alkylhydroperoxidase
MATLNRAAAQAMKEAGASACTDVTGFGLLGHLLRLARQGRLTAQVFAHALPAFEGALEALREGVISGAVERNLEFVGDDLEVDPKVEEALVHLGCDAQTSGGLLIAIAPHRLRALQDALARGGAQGFLIGKFLEPSHGRIHLVPSENPSPDSDAPECRLEPAAQVPVPAVNPSPHSEPHPADCCAGVFDAKAPSTTTPDAERAFGALLRAAQAPGALDAKTKELILLSLVVYSRCAPCFAAHQQKARDLGLTQAELDEAAWCAIAMGGAPVRIFYQEASRGK